MAATTDGLTRLYNRTEIERRIREALAESKRDVSGGGLCLIMLDIDNFKRVNDTYGHREGDLVIIGLSDVLKKAAEDSPEISVGRWGGEEFMMLLKGKSSDRLEELAEEIRKDFMSISFPNAGHQTVSVGITRLQDNETVDSLCSRVDKALYSAKETGKNRVVAL